MGMYVCHLYCLRYVDTVIGLKSYDQGVCISWNAKLAWVVFFSFNSNFFLDFLVQKFYCLYIFILIEAFEMGFKMICLVVNLVNRALVKTKLM